ncbi:MAG: hypothetical protein E7I76_02140 [Anaerococcus vaginalis]|uniref:hypothetical protein n=1 Tax=Anaerococcus vaginalis TaxID=33037 RepID=UPI00290A7CB2|nr:hypothetical protein [Anaerococcus vaginalis]MDU7433343.1 hypothetical protein [Anaerococcus vaginalis]
MKYYLLIGLLVWIIFIKSIQNKIITKTMFLPIYYFICLGLFLILFLIIYKFSFTFLDFSIIFLISFGFFLSLKSQGITKNSIIIFEKNFLLFKSIKFNDIKNIETIKNSKCPKCRIWAYGNFYDFYFKDYKYIVIFKNIFENYIDHKL